MRTVQVYIEGQRLDLFDDETINVTSTQQNVQDISKVFSDFSQSFSVPASPSNNAIFQHFYQNDIDSTLDFNIRRSGNIEIDLTPFRTGKISLEKSEVKNNKAYSYQITFYGDLVSLKDTFGEDFLTDLDHLQTFNFTYDATNVKNRIIDGSTDYDARFPLISTERSWQYGGGGSNDITIDDGAIAYNDLFPCLKISKIFEAIENKYTIDFQGTFLSDKRFTECFLWCRPGDLLPTDIPGTNTQNLSFDTIGQFLEYEYIGTSEAGQGSHKVTLNINPSNDTIQYTVLVYDFGTPFTTITGTGQQTFEIIDEPDAPESLSRIFSFQVFAAFPMDIEATVVKFFTSFGEDPTSPGDFIETVLTDAFSTPSYSLLGQVNFNNLIPRMKVEDFFAGILKEFNLTCYALSSDVYQVEPLTDWYSKGAIVDITEYTDIESIQIDRVKLYKKIIFEYEKSQSVINKRFFALYNREYGNLEAEFNYDGGEYKIKVPFENLQFSKFTGTNLQVGYVLNENLEKYENKPLLLYNTGNFANTFKFDNGSSIETLSACQIFGQDLDFENTDYSLNFGNEVSTFLLTPVTFGLYGTYYFPYLANLFNLKNRETSVKTILPISLLTNLRLNDRVIIRDKRYVINDMQSNLTTGEVNFTLLNDFSPLISDGGSPPIDPLLPSLAGQCLDVRILFPNGATSAAVTTSDAGVTITPSSFITDGTAQVCIPANTDTLQLIKTEDDADFINTENFIRLSTEQSSVHIYTITVTYTYANGNTVANQMFIQQQP